MLKFLHKAFLSIFSDVLGLRNYNLYVPVRAEWPEWLVNTGLHCSLNGSLVTLISLINVTSRLPILENSTLHKTKILPARLFISLQNFQYSYKTLINKNATKVPIR